MIFTSWRIVLAIEYELTDTVRKMPRKERSRLAKLTIDNPDVDRIESSLLTNNFERLCYLRIAKTKLISFPTGLKDLAFLKTLKYVNNPLTTDFSNIFTIP